MEIALENRSKINDTELAFVCAAIAKQMKEHFCPAWTEEPWAVKFYKELDNLSIGSFWPVSVLPNLGEQGAAPFEKWVPGLSYGCIREGNGHAPISIEASHTCLELRMDPRCIKWVHLGQGCFAAVEICDPCEGVSYEIDVTVLGEKRKILVSDFVLPSYFVRGARGPYSFCNAIETTIHERGLASSGNGYLLLRLPHGEVIDWWGKTRFGISNKKAPASWKKGEDYLSRIFQRKMGVLGEIVDYSEKLR